MCWNHVCSDCALYFTYVAIIEWLWSALIGFYITLLVLRCFVNYEPYVTFSKQGVISPGEGPAFTHPLMDHLV